MAPVKKALASFLAMSAILLAALPSGAETNPPPKLSISYGIGPGFALGRLHDNYGAGIAQGIEINFRFHKNIGFVALFNHTLYNWNPRNPNPIVYSYEYGEFACYGYFGGLKGIFPVSRRLTLYALAGAGSCEQESGDYCVKEKRPGPGGGVMEVTTWKFNVFQGGYYFGLIVGGGVEYELSRRFALFAEVRFVSIFNTPRTPRPQWADLPAEIYQNPPDAFIMPVLFGLRFKI